MSKTEAVDTFYRLKTTSKERRLTSEEHALFSACCAVFNDRTGRQLLGEALSQTWGRR